MDPTTTDGLPVRVRAEQERRRRLQRKALAEKYDWFGDECPCGVPLGDCREHPRARPNQRRPGSYRSASDRDDWLVWMVEGGRGFGKTWTGATDLTAAILRGEATRIALVNDTQRDVRDVQVAALEQVAPPWCKPLYEPSKATVTWRNDRGDELAVAGMYSAETPDALRGPQFDFAWCDELAKWKHRQAEAWEMLQFCMRIGMRPRIVVTSTPRPTPTYVAVRSHPRTAITRGSTLDNKANLAPSFLENIYQKYDGTRLGQQELNADLLLDTPGALWTTDLLERTRVRDTERRPDYPAPVPRGVQFVRIVVGVDPASGAADPDRADEAGIVVVARGSDGHGYILEDRTVKGTPDDWARAALRAYEDWHAHVIVAERNNGGLMVEQTIRNATLDGRPAGLNAPIKTVWASHGKHTRAEPVSMLFEQGRCHVVGLLPTLEAQLTRWTPEDTDSPDRLDAMVWACHEALVEFYSAPRPVAIPRREPMSLVP